MSEQKFSALLSLIVPAVVGMVAERFGLSEIEATRRFYCSQVYAKLSDEKTKLWHYSAPTLFAMYEDEAAGREVEYPEEAC